MIRCLTRVVASILVLAAPLAAADEDLVAVQKKIASLFPEIQAQHVFQSPIDGWYTIRKGAIVAYVSADGRYLLQGDLIDLDEQVNLSEESRNEARREMMASYPADDMIIFSPQDKKHSVAVFTDIDCTFCRRLHNQIDDYLARGIEVRYLLYPRNGPTSPSWAKAEQVWCADDRNEALTLAKRDQEFESHSCNPAVVGTHYAMGRDVGLTGTPALVLEDGTLVSGYLPPEQLEQALSAEPD
ncbi:MAG: DsbC family protein [Woeseiaceae bacterium]|nr:DsbC family protein [Woeseiaceae bacterium]